MVKRMVIPRWEWRVRRFFDKNTGIILISIIAVILAILACTPR